MKQKIISPVVSMVLGLSALTMMTSGCSNVDEALGKTKSAPDEFEVVVRPPLTLPPNFNLNPENDTAEAPVSSTDAVSVSTRVLTNNASTDASVFDTLLGTENRVAGIRELVNEETYGIQLERRLPIEIIFGGQPNVGPNLDSTKEALRLREAFEKGQGITVTPTPAIDPVEGTPVTVE